MNKCSNPKIGRLITRYEFNQVSNEERKVFEAHILECDYCAEDLYKMAPVIKMIKDDPEEILKVLNKNIQEHEAHNSINLNQIYTDFINNISDFFEFLFFQHRFTTITAGAFGIVLLFSVILWRNNIFETSTTGKKTELAQNEKKPDVPVQIGKTETPSGIQKQTTSEQSIPAHKYDIGDIASLAAIDHDDYSSLLSQKQESTENQFEEGIKNYEEKNYQRAIVYLSSVEETDENYFEAQFYLGMSYLLLKDIKRGVNCLKSSTGTSSKILFEKSHWYLGNAYLLKNDRENAVKEFQIVTGLSGAHKAKAQKILDNIL